MQQYIEWANSTLDSYVELAGTLNDYLPNLVGALAFLILGWFVAILVRFILLKLGNGLDKLIVRFGKQLGFNHIQPHRSIAHIVANTVFWIIILFVLGTILRTLGWPGLLMLLHDYFPRLLGSLFIILAGYVISNLIAYTIHHYRGIKEAYAQTLGKSIQLIIVSFSILMALDHLGLNMTLFNNLFLIIISFFLFGAALAFGLGARGSISHLLAMRNVRQHYKIGQKVIVGEIEGQIIDIKSHIIVVQTSKGKAIIPGDVFYDNITFLLDSEKNA